MPQLYFNSDGFIQVYDPLSNKTASSTFTNTAGSAKCAKKDPTECTITKISMIDSATGDFGADFNLPNALPVASSTVEGRMISNMFTGDRVFVEKSSDIIWVTLDEDNNNYNDASKDSIFGDDLPW